VEVGDIEKASRETDPSLVVVAIGTGLSKEPGRTKSACALIEALQRTKCAAHIVVVSSLGAGDSVIRYSVPCMGRLVEYILQNALADHTTQEEAFLAAHCDVTIVRPTGLGDGDLAGNTVVFDGVHGTGPTGRIQRANVAEWIAQRFCGVEPMPTGGVFHITQDKD